MLDSCTTLLPCPKPNAYSVAPRRGSNLACPSLFRALGDLAYGTESKTPVDHMKITENALQRLYSQKEGLQRGKERHSYMAPDTGL